MHRPPGALPAGLNKEPVDSMCEKQDKTQLAEFFTEDHKFSDQIIYTN